MDIKDIESTRAKVRSRQSDLDQWQQVASLYGEHFDRLVLMAQHWGRCASSAEEAVQEAFVKLAHRSASSEPIRRPVPYLRMMVMNEIRSVARRDTRRGELERLAADREEEESVEAAAIADASLGSLVALLDTLSDRQAEVIRLRYLVGLSEVETAHRLGIARGSVKTHASRGREAIRCELVPAA